MVNKIILLFFLALFGLVGCSKPKEVISEQKVNVEPKKMINSNTSEKIPFTMEFSLLDESSIDENQIIYKLNENEKFTPSITLKNGFPNPTKYRLFFLLNYIQTPVKYNNENVNFIDVNLKENENINFDVDIEQIPNGLNDLVVFAVRDPDNLLDKDQYVSASQVYMARRAEIIVNNELMPREVKYTDVNVYKSKEETEGATIPFVTIDSKNFIDKITRLTDLSSKLQLIKGTPNKSNYAIFAIIGKKQIEVINPFIHVNDIGDFKTPFLEFPLNELNENSNLIVGIVQEPFTTNKETLLLQQVEFVNLMSVINE